MAEQGLQTEDETGEYECPVCKKTVYPKDEEAETHWMGIKGHGIWTCVNRP